MVFNFIIILVCLNLYICNSSKKEEDLTYRQNKDTVIINIYCDKDSINLDNSIIELQLINTKTDTLLLLSNPFFVESSFLTEFYPWVMWSRMFSTPNIIYIENNKSMLKYSGDAMYKPDFPAMPSLVKFEPNDTVTFKINLPLKIAKNIACNNKYIGGAIVYTNKFHADSIAAQSNNFINNDYQKSLKNENVINIELVQPQEFQGLLSEEQNTNPVSRFIWDIFDRKFSFEDAN